MYFGENLQILRKRDNLSQEDLADKLQVSRQAVSKWESGTGFPETEKLITICEIFNCSMDELVKGKISSDPTSSKEKYNSLMDRFSRNISIAIMLILIGVTILLTIMGFAHNESQEELYGNYGVVILLVFVAMAVPIFIVNGIEMDNFKKKYPKLTNFYSDEEVDKYNSQFSKKIALSVSTIIIGVVVFLGSISLGIFSEESTFPSAILLLFITIAVPIIVSSGIQKDKYNIDEYNKKNSDEEREKENKIGKYCGIIMIVTTIIYLVISFIFNIWEISWIAYVVGGMLCGIVSIVLKK